MPPDVDLQRLVDVAWTYRERALTPRQASRRTQVGAAVRAHDGSIFGGCNVQQRFHSYDVHAELNALTTMIAEGRRRLVAIVIVAEIPGLAPCGSCLDWILQFGGDDCLVAWQHERDGDLERHAAGALMPRHPSYGTANDA